jgi:hypothetical protein
MHCLHLFIHDRHVNRLDEEVLLPLVFATLAISSSVFLYCFSNMVAGGCVLVGGCLHGLMKGTVAPAAPFGAFDDIATMEIGLLWQPGEWAGEQGGRDEMTRAKYDFVEPMTRVSAS